MTQWKMLRLQGVSLQLQNAFVENGMSDVAAWLSRNTLELNSSIKQEYLSKHPPKSKRKNPT